MTPILHGLCGTLASGKTTLAKRIAEEAGAVLVCEDNWLSKVFPGEIATFAGYLNRSARFRRAFAPHARSLLGCGTSVVLDFAGNAPQERARVRSRCYADGVRVVLHWQLLESVTKTKGGRPC